MKRKTVGTVLAAGILIAFCVLDAVPAREAVRHRLAGHGARSRIANPSPSIEPKARGAGRRRKVGAFEGKLLEVSFSGGEQPMLLENARFNTIRGRTFLVGNRVRLEGAADSRVEAHVAWDSMEAFHVFESIEQYETAIHRAIETALQTSIPLFGDAPDERGIRSVSVPMIDTAKVKPSFGEWLTEAVVKEIEHCTPFRVTYASKADSVLSCTAESKILDGETAYVLSAQWSDRRGNQLRRLVSLPLPAVDLSPSVFPELGQSLTYSEQLAIESLARQIVEMMEATW